MTGSQQSDPLKNPAGDNRETQLLADAVEGVGGGAVSAKALRAYQMPRAGQRRRARDSRATGSRGPWSSRQHGALRHREPRCLQGDAPARSRPVAPLRAIVAIITPQPGEEREAGAWEATATLAAIRTRPHPAPNCCPAALPRSSLHPPSRDRSRYGCRTL